jgi:hypothetical protein
MLLHLLTAAFGTKRRCRDVRFYAANEGIADVKRGLVGLSGTSGMTDYQFQLILRHLQVMIAILGVIAGVLIAFAWTYL